jgi:large subunit ribosomal protein L25
MTISLTAVKREKTDKIDTLRKEGRIPAVFYGAKEASTPISVLETDFIKVYRQAGESSIVSLKTPEGDHDALIQAIDFEPVYGKVRHVDFYVVEKGKKIQVGIPLTFEGEAPAVKLGGTLTKVLHEIEIEATPADLPHDLVVSVDSLVDFDSQILAKDIKLPAGVELITDGEEVVALVSEVKEEEEESTPVDLSSIEVSVEKGKKEEEAPTTE